ncbi:hypothetical protein MRX96_036278 [Rhipicephalus microplus]
MLPSLDSLQRTSKSSSDREGDLTSALQLTVSCCKLSAVSPTSTTQPPTPLTVYASIYTTTHLLSAPDLNHAHVSTSVYLNSARVLSLPPTAYMAAPDNTLRGIIHNAIDSQTQDDINQDLQSMIVNTPCAIAGARRMGRLKFILITFVGTTILYSSIVFNCGFYRCHLFRPKTEAFIICWTPGHCADVCIKPNSLVLTQTPFPPAPAEESMKTAPSAASSRAPFHTRQPPQKRQSPSSDAITAHERDVVRETTCFLESFERCIMIRFTPLEERVAPSTRTWPPSAPASPP